MRIKKYENWKFNHNQINNLFSTSKSQSPQLFSVSQLLEIPKKSNTHEDEQRQSIFTDPRTNANYFNLNRRILNKREIIINQLTNPNRKQQREASIKNKIKERLKQQYSTQNYNLISPKTFFKQEATQNNYVKDQEKIKNYLRGNKVYIKGNSVGFNSFENQKRSKSTFLKSSLQNINKKIALTKIEKLFKEETQKTFRKKFNSVQMKRKISSSLGQRDMATSFVFKKNSLKDIEPWQYNEDTNDFDE